MTSEDQVPPPVGPKVHDNQVLDPPGGSVVSVAETWPRDFLGERAVAVPEAETLPGALCTELSDSPAEPTPTSAPPTFTADAPPSQSFDAEWSAAQQRLAQLVLAAWYRSLDNGHIRWPDYNYLEHELRARASVDAAEVLASYPVLGTVGINSPYYSHVAYDRMCPSRPEGPVHLTVAGLARATQGHQDPASFFFDLLHHAGQTRASARLDPYDPQPVLITSESFTTAYNLGPEIGMAMYDLIAREPYAVTGLSRRQHNPEDGTWTAQVGVRALDFTNGTTLDTYIEQIKRYLDDIPPLPGMAIWGVPASQAQGVQIGSGNTQINNYGHP